MPSISRIQKSGDRPRTSPVYSTSSRTTLRGGRSTLAHAPPGLARQRDRDAPCGRFTAAARRAVGWNHRIEHDRVAADPVVERDEDRRSFLKEVRDHESVGSNDLVGAVVDLVAEFVKRTELPVGREEVRVSPWQRSPTWMLLVRNARGGDMDELGGSVQRGLSEPCVRQCPHVVLAVGLPLPYSNERRARRCRARWSRETQESAAQNRWEK